MLQMKKNPRSQMAHSNAFSVVDPPDKRHRKLVGSENFESESDVGSLMSGLSQARKVPDRRRFPRPGGGRNLNDQSSKTAKTIAATKIQAMARGYIQRFAYQSWLIMEESKKKFFAIQIQAIVRGHLARTHTL